MTQIITRFAPSPTGYLHIGGARTALFNWLFAKHFGGTFHLRIEDTDRARSTQEAVDALVDGLGWLGLKWDGEIVYQFSRMKRHAEVAHELVKQGKAYYCTCTAEELDKMRAEQKAAGVTTTYDRRCRDKNHTSGVVRIKAPNAAGNMTVNDAVHGAVEVPYTQLDDMVLLRSDGTPTYMLSVVVDDHDMHISHVIRGDDHLTNTFRQRMIYEAMGWDVPQFAHIPMILGPDGAKLSKRHGAVGIEKYRDMGYLPEAMRNYLLRLGWGHGDAEILSTEEAIALFTLDGAGSSPSRMDFAKLASVNAHYMRGLSDDKLFEAVMPFLGSTDETGRTRFKTGLHDLKERAQTLTDLAAAGHFYVTRPTPNDDAKKALDEPARALLKDVAATLSPLPAFTHEAIEAALKELATQKELKLGKVAMPLRAALTGTTNSPSVFHVAEILGKDETLARLGNVR